MAENADKTAAWLKGAAADKVWRDGRTTNFNRAVLDVLAEREYLVRVVQAARELERRARSNRDNATMNALRAALDKLDEAPL
jgi:hypothetical protein